MNRTALLAVSVVVSAVVLFGLTLFGDGKKRAVPERGRAGWREGSATEGGRYASRRLEGGDPLRGDDIGPIRGGGGGDKIGVSGERAGGAKQANGDTGGARGEDHWGRDDRIGPGASRSGGALASSIAGGIGGDATAGIDEGRAPGLRERADARRGEVVDSLSRQPPQTRVDSASETADEAEHDDAVELPSVDNGVIAFPPEASTQDKGGALKFEIQPDWDGTSQDVQSFVRIASSQPGNSNRLEMYREDNGSLRLVFRDNAENERSLSVPVSDWVADQRHTIAVSWQNGELEFLVDGSSVGKTTYPGKLEFVDEARIYVGKAASHMHKVESAGVLENFKLYPHSLSEGDR
jgi:hypothetical protein